nr:hypothetical protein [Tanacetum cinerariifolium]
MNQLMTEAVRVAVQIQTKRLRDSYQRENVEFLRTIDENMKRIIKEQVKGQVKEQVSRILPRIEQSVNAQLEAEVLTRSSHSLRTSYARRREGKEPESASAPLETATRSAGRSTIGSKSRQVSASESAFVEEPVQTTSKMDEPSYPVFETGADDQPIVQSSHNPEWFSQPKKPPTLDQLEYHLEEVYKATTDQLDWVNPEGQQYPHNLLQPLSLIPDNRSRRVIPFAHFIKNDLEYLRGGASSRKYTTSVTKTKAADYGNIKWIEDLVPRTMWIQEPIDYDKHALWGVSQWGRKRQQFYGFAVNRESALDVYSKRRIIADVHKKHRHPATCGRSSTGSQKLPEEAQPYQAIYVLFRSEAKGSVYCLFKPMRIHLSKQGQEKQYLPQTIWRKGDKVRAAAMIQAIDKMLKTRRIMRSLENFVGGRLYEGDFQMLQRTI